MRAVAIELDGVLGDTRPLWRDWLQEAQSSAEREHIQGKAVTPYLLDRVASLSGGRTVQANIALLESNAILAAEVAVAFSS